MRPLVMKVWEGGRPSETTGRKRRVILDREMGERCPGASLRA